MQKSNLLSRHIILMCLSVQWQFTEDLAYDRQTHVASKKQCICEGIKLNDTLITNSSELSDAFNVRFSTIGPNLGNEVPPGLPWMIQAMLITLLVVTAGLVSVQLIVVQLMLVLSQINYPHPKLQALNCGISANLIRECADLISSPL